MNTEENFFHFKSMESEVIKELYKKTPLKKRPIKASSLSPDEKKTSPKPRACTLPEGRLSKRKMYKPTKKLIDSYVKSTAVIDTSPKPMYVPVIKSTAESRAITPVKINNKAVNFAMAMAIPELKKTSVGTKVSSRTPKWSKEIRNLTQQEWEDFNLALEIQNEEFNLRERRPRREKQDLQKIPKQRAMRSGPNVKDAFAGNHLLKMYQLSDVLSGIVSNKKLTATAVINAMNYVFLERNLFEPDKKHVICDDELSEKLFAGKRRIRLDDVKLYLNKHLTPIT